MKRLLYTIFTIVLLCAQQLPVRCIENDSFINENQLKEGEQKAHAFAQQLATLSNNPQEFSEQNVTQQIQAMRHQQNLLKKEISYLKEKQQTTQLAQNTPFFSFSTAFTSELWYGANLELLNDHNPYDNYSFAQTIFDIEWRTRRSQWHEILQPVELKCTARFKGIMGNVGAYTQSSENFIKIGKALTETDHSHSINRLLLWARELYLKYYYNDLLPSSFFQVGIFPFHIGHGFSLGDAHYVGCTLPGQMSQNVVDQFRPGALFSAGFFDNIVTLQAYAALITTKSESLSATASLENAESLESGQKAYRGPFKKNLVMAAQSIYDIARDPSGKKVFNVTPYCIFQNDNNTALEFPNDSSHRLFTPGISINYETPRLSCSFEVAHNFGSQSVKKWDRNQRVNMGGKEVNDHLFYIPADTADVDFDQATFVGSGATDPDDFELSTIEILPQSISRNYANGEIFVIAKGTTPETYNYFKNSNTRFRRGYKNKYDGWMVYGDILYNITPSWKVGTAVGCASGDNAPNDLEEKILLSRLYEAGVTAPVYKDINKTYKGFIGVQELFEGKAIHSHFMLEAQKLIHFIVPSTFVTRPTFSNLIFWGLGSSYHKNNNGKNINAQCNIIAFLNHRAVEKNYSLPLSDYWAYTHETFTNAKQADAAKKLGLHLGTECNARLDLQISRDVSLFGSCALFIPGKHYTDAQGKYASLATQIELAGTDFSGIEDEPSKYDFTLGKDTAFLLSAGISAEFDSIKWSSRTTRSKRPFAFLNTPFTVF